MLGNFAAIIPGRISYYLDLKGPSMIVNTACSSSLVAVHLACQAIRSGECDQAIAGGIKINLFPMFDFPKIGLESDDGLTRSFDESGKGTNWSEGVAAIVLKPLHRAIRDKDNIYAVIKGGAVNQDGQSADLAAPDGEAQKEVILSSWRDARVDPVTISYIETHGTGTSKGDYIEMTSIARAFKKYTDRKQFCAVSSVKPNLGHAIEAAGIISLIKAVYSLRYGKLLPSIHFTEPNHFIDWKESPIYLNTKLSAWKVKGDTPRRCGVSAFGLSGTNCHLVLEEAPGNIDNLQLSTNGGKVKPQPQPEGQTYVDFTSDSSELFVLSAARPEALKILISKYRNYISGLWPERNEGLLKRICYTASTGREHRNYRLAIIASNLYDLKDKLSKASKAELGRSTIKDVFYGFHQIILPNIIETDRTGITKEKQLALSEQAEIQLKTYGRERKSGGIDKLRKAAELYILGANPDWKLLFSETKQSKLNLPTYPFARTRCWLEIPEVDPGIIFFHRIAWSEVRISESFPLTAEFGSIILFADRGTGIEEEIGRRFRALDLIRVRLGRKYRQIDRNNYIIANTGPDYEQLIKELKGRNIDKIIHAFNVDKVGEIASIDDLNHSQELGAMSLFHMIKSIQSNHLSKPIDIILLAQNTNQVTGNETRLRPESAPLIGLGKTIRLENHNLNCRAIDFDEYTGMNTIVDEILSPYSSYQVAYRHNIRHIDILDKLDTTQARRRPFKIRNSGVYIIAGGAGEIGLEIAKYFSQENSQLNLALLGRSRLTREKSSALDKIRQNRASVDYYQVDITDPEKLNAVLERIRHRYNGIRGIIQAAGINDYCTIDQQTGHKFRQILSPKIQGTWLLHRFTKADKLDFFILFSSAVTAGGSRGMGAYTAANAYLNTFAEQNGLLAINWTYWKNVGLVKKFKIDENKQIFKIISQHQAIRAFSQAIQKVTPHYIFIGELNQQSDFLKWRNFLPLNFSPSPQKEEVGPESSPKPIINEIKTKNIILRGRADQKYSYTEKTLADIWNQLLGHTDINIHDNLLEAGGDSIVIVRLQAEIKERFNVEIPLTELLSNLTIANLAELIIRQKQNNFEIPIKSVSNKSVFPLTSMQKKIWIMEKINPRSALYNLGYISKLKGELKVPVLEQSLQMLVNRHDILRTNVVETEEGLPTQIVKRKVDIKLNVIDISKEEEAKKDKLEKELSGNIIYTPFDKSDDIPIRAQLIKLKENKYVFVLVLHHIIADLWSLDIIFKELYDLYNAYLENREINLSQPEIQYQDYADYESSQEYKEKIKNQEIYWLEHFADGLPDLNIPLDKPRPKRQIYHGGKVSMRIGWKSAEKLDKLAQKNNATRFMLLLAIFMLFLHKVSRQKEIIVGTFIATRDSRMLQNMVGLFLNSCAIKSVFSDNMTFRQLLGNIKKTVSGAIANKDYPFERLIEHLKPTRDLKRHPIFNVTFQVLKRYMNEDINDRANLSAERFPIDNTEGQYDLSLKIEEMNDELVYVFGYNTSLFHRQTVKNYLQQLSTLTESITANPDQEISNCEMFTVQDKKLLEKFNGTDDDFPLEKNISELFEIQTKKTPDNIAVSFENENLTYRELGEEVNRLANYIIKTRAISKGEIIGIYMERSIDFLIAVLGILKIGAIYVPLEPSHPVKRTGFIVNETKLCLVITSKTCKDKLKEIDVDILCFDSVRAEIGKERKKHIKEAIKPNDTACIIYTSGSSGRPKGVLLSHRGIINHLYTKIKAARINERDNIGQNLTSGFVASIWQLLAPLFVGAKLTIYDDSIAKNPVRLFHRMETDRITLTEITPSILRTFLAAKRISGQEMKLPKLKMIFIGGEEIDRRLVNDYHKSFSVPLLNSYGQTEYPGSAMPYVIPADIDFDIIPVGHPAPNTQIYILDERMKPLPINIIGEIFIAGAGLAKGYLNDPRLTRNTFLPHPYIKGETIYKSGDLGRFLPDGSMEYRGRIDRQVKIRGNRIELGEIEAIMKKYPQIKSAAIVCKTGKANNNYLVAFYSAQNEINKSDLINYLRKYLPVYMIPAYFTELPEMPLNENGKVDRQILSQTEYDAYQPKIFQLPQTKTEKTIAKIWQNVLGTANFGINDNFLDIGGDSLKIVQVHAYLEKIYPNKINVAQLFSYPTIHSLAGKVSGFRQETGFLPVTNAPSKSADIAVVGMALKTSLADNPEKFWQKIIMRRNGIGIIPPARKEDADRYLNFINYRNNKGRGKPYDYFKSSYLGNVDKFDYQYFGLSPQEARLMDPSQRLFLETVIAAVENAGISKDKLAGTKTGVFVGYASTRVKLEYSNIIDVISPDLGSQASPGNISAIIPSRISHYLNLKGPSLVINSACSSSLVAVHTACRSIVNGECEQVIAGGIKIDLFPLTDFPWLGAESMDGTTRTFDGDTEGTGIGEGVAAVLLKPLDRALRDRDNIYAVIKGSAINQDGRSAGLTAPNARAQEEVIVSAWQAAGIDPSTVSYIEAHGTGTKLGDPIEIEGITQAFRRFTRKIAILQNRLYQNEYRAYRRSGRPLRPGQGSPRPQAPAASPFPPFSRTQPPDRLEFFPGLRQHRPGRVDRPGGPTPALRRELLRHFRHQLPCRPGRGAAPARGCGRAAANTRRQPDFHPLRQEGKRARTAGPGFLRFPGYSGAPGRRAHPGQPLLYRLRRPRALPLPPGSDRP